MTREVELIGDVDEISSATSTLKNGIGKLWIKAVDMYKSLPGSDIKEKIWNALGNIMAEIKAAPHDLNNLNLNYSRLKKLTTMIEIQLSDADPYGDLSEASQSRKKKAVKKETLRKAINNLSRKAQELSRLYSKTRDKRVYRKFRSTMKQLKRLVEMQKLGNLGDFNAASGFSDKLILGKNPETKPRSVEQIPQAISVGVSDGGVSDFAYGVGSGMGDDFEDIGYYAETQMGYLGYNDTAYVKATVAGVVSKEEIENPDYQVPETPGGSPFEVRIRESVNEYSKASSIRAREKSPSQVIKRKNQRKLREYGQGPDKRSARMQNKIEGRTVNQEIARNRKLESAPVAKISGVDDRFYEPKIETRRSGGHMYIEDLDDDDDEFILL